MNPSIPPGTAGRPARPRAPRRGPQGMQPGFILAATLWSLAAVTVLATYINSVATDNVERAQAQRQALQDELDAHSTENTLIYLLASSRMNHRGMVLEQEQRFSEPDRQPLKHPGDGTLPLSGEVHAGLGRIRFFVQDERGLFGINSPDQPFLARALEYVGVSSADAARLMPRIRDYIDLDDRISLSGAERFDYSRAKRRPPANWYMAGSPELKRVLGADELLTDDQWRLLRPLLTPRQQLGYNFNTMPAAAVAAFVGGDEAAQHLLEKRAEQVIRTPEDVGELTGRTLRLRSEDLLTFPSPNCRIAVWPEGARRRSLIGITLTPGAADAPWRKEYRYSEPIDGAPGPALKAATPLFQAT